MTKMFDFLYDDEAPGPLEQIGAAVKSGARNTCAAVGKAAATETGQQMKQAASIGLVIGAGLGALTIAMGAARAVTRTVFGE